MNTPVRPVVVRRSEAELREEYGDTLWGREGAQLLDPLPDGEGLPDSCDPDVMEATCRLWVARHNAGLASGETLHIPLPNHLFCRVSTARPLPYPIPVYGADHRNEMYLARWSVGLVIRQWIESPPEASLAEFLRNDPHWSAAAEEWRSLYAPYKELCEHLAAEASQPISEIPALLRLRGYDGPHFTHEDARSMLLSWNLPATDASVRFFLGEVLKEDSESFSEVEPPSRGVLVESIMLSEDSAAEGMHTLTGLYGDALCTISGSLLWAGATWGDAQRTAIKHRDMWVRMGQMADTRLTKVNKGKRRPPYARALEELREAYGTIPASELDVLAGEEAIRMRTKEADEARALGRPASDVPPSSTFRRQARHKIAQHCHDNGIPFEAKKSMRR